MLSARQQRIDTYSDLLPLNNPPIYYFALNMVGRDFVVGDIHGMFDLLEDKLNAVDFDRSKDRLFAVGDLIDRGHESHFAVDYLKRDWFHSVLGNHDAMCILEDDIEVFNVWQNNGGSWCYTYPEEVQEFKVLAREMPYLIQIATKKGLVGIVHSTVGGRPWKQIITDLCEGDKEAMFYCLWDRDLQWFSDDDIIALYAGHSIVPSYDEKYTYDKFHMIDTGAYRTNRLTLVEL